MTQLIYDFIIEMLLGFQIWVGIICPPPLVGIGLGDFPNSRWAKAHPSYRITGQLHEVFTLLNFLYPLWFLKDQRNPYA